MKKKFTIGGIFVITYVVFLIATLPATVLLGQLTLPKELNVSGLTGSVWHTEIKHITVGTTTVHKVNTQLSVWSLFTFTKRSLVYRLLFSSFVAVPIDSLIFLGVLHQLNLAGFLVMNFSKWCGIVFVFMFWYFRNKRNEPSVVATA